MKNALYSLLVIIGFFVCIVAAFLFLLGLTFLGGGSGAEWKGFDNLLIGSSIPTGVIGFLVLKFAYKKLGQ